MDSKIAESGLIDLIRQYTAQSADCVELFMQAIDQLDSLHYDSKLNRQIIAEQTAKIKKLREQNAVLMQACQEARDVISMRLPDSLGYREQPDGVRYSVRDQLIGHLDKAISEAKLRGQDDTAAETEQHDVRELLAQYAHVAWSGWMSYMFERSVANSDGTMTIPAELVARWQRQVQTPYPLLPENEKESDRHEADTILAITQDHTR